MTAQLPLLKNTTWSVVYRFLTVFNLLSLMLPGRYGVFLKSFFIDLEEIVHGTNWCSLVKTDYAFTSLFGYGK